MAARPPLSRIGRYNYCAFFAALSLGIFLPILGLGWFYNGTDSDHVLVAKNLTEHKQYSFFAHPPLIFSFLSASFMVFGYTTLAARLPFFVLFLVGLVFTYALALRLFGLGAAILSTFFYIFSSTIFQGVVIYWMDLALMSFVLGSVYFHLIFLDTKKPAPLLLSGIFAGLAILTKESGILLFPVFAFSLWRNKLIKAGWRMFIPMLATTFFWLVLYSILDFREFLSNFSLIATKLVSLRELTAYAGKSGFGGAILIFSAVAMLASISLRDKKEMSAIWAVVLLFFPFFAFTIFRYAMPALPLLYILAAHGLLNAIRSKAHRWLPFLALSLTVLFLLTYFSDFREQRKTAINFLEDPPERSLHNYLQENTPANASFLVFKQSSMSWIDYYLGRETRHVTFFGLQNNDIKTQHTKPKEDYVIFHRDYRISREARALYSHFSGVCARISIGSMGTSAEYILLRCKPQ